MYELQAFDSRDSYDPHLPDVVQHQPPEFNVPTGRQSYGQSRRESNVMPSRPPPPERIRSVREDMMKARTMLPDAPKGNGKLRVFSFKKCILNRLGPVHAVTEW